MSDHDYMCFVQRNGQYLNDDNLKLGNKGQRECIVVLVPDTVNIDKLDYTDFAQYKTLKLNTYSRKTGDFKELTGYNKYYDRVTYPGLNEEQSHKAFWRHIKYPGYNLVNFEPQSYNRFVLEKVGKDIPCSTYIAILANRGIQSSEINRRILYNLVVDSCLSEGNKPLKSLPDNGLHYIAERCSSVLSIIAQYAMPAKWRDNLVSNDTLIWLRKEGIVTKEQRGNGVFASTVFQWRPEVIKELITFWNLEFINVFPVLPRLDVDTLVHIRGKRPNEYQQINTYHHIVLPSQVEALKELFDNWGLIITSDDINRYNFMPVCDVGRCIGLPMVLSSLQYIRQRIGYHAKLVDFHQYMNKIIDTNDILLYNELSTHWGLTASAMRQCNALSYYIAQRDSRGIRFLASLGIYHGHFDAQFERFRTIVHLDDYTPETIKALKECGMNRSHTTAIRNYAASVGNAKMVEACDSLPAKLILNISF